MDLKEIMGDAYNDSMTKEEVQAYFKKQVLSTGEYENREKANAEKKALENQINEYKKQIADKMTDDEKKKASDEETKKFIEDLQRQLEESKKSISLGTATTGLANAKIKCGIKENDKDFSNFIDNISNSDNEKTRTISQYVNKLVEMAYENGKNSMLKDKLGKMGSFKDGDSGENDKGSYGKQLAEMTKVNQENKKNFFERKM